MHRLSRLRIKNFRACKDVTLQLDSYTPLVGQNNAGKSSILRAIEWVLKPNALAAKDFRDPAESVEVIACIDGIEDNILRQIPDEKHRRAIEPYCHQGRLWIRAVATGKSAKALIREVWDVTKYSGQTEPEIWREYPTGLPQAVSALLPEPVFVQAMHDINEDLGKAKAGTTIKYLLDEIMGPLIEAHMELNAALDTIRNVLTTEGSSRSQHLLRFDNEASSILASFFPGLSIDLDLQTLDLREFFKAGDLHVTDQITGDRRRFDQVGSGAQRAIQMALIRYLAEARDVARASSSRRLLLIDEPELYLHPQGVRRLRQALSSLSQSGFQVVFSTHSPLMLNRVNAADTVIVGKNSEDGVTARKPLRHAVDEAIQGAKSQTRTLFALGNIADIYFAERVVLCEGKTDHRLLPLAYERLYGQTPDLDQIAFVPLGSCADIPKALPVLAAMGIRACAIADLDFAYTHARTGKVLDRRGKDLINTKRILARLQSVHGFKLNGNGLPQNDKQSAWTAADDWALFALDEEGKAVVQGTHQDLKQSRIWVWVEGCIEQITVATDKGEEAIDEQEQLLQKLTAAEISAQMPSLQMCFEWIRSS